MKMISRTSMTRKVSMSDVVAPGQSRAARRVVKRAVVASIKDQAQMSRRARAYN